MVAGLYSQASHTQAEEPLFYIEAQKKPGQQPTDPEQQPQPNPHETPEEAMEDSKVVYPASYFSQYSPISARDMLDRIPGIDQILNGDDGSRRGLGAGGDQVLIDGKRIAGKSNDSREVLERISADSVERIEIIRGTSAELDVRSAGPIANIVLREGANRTNISAELNADYYQRDGGLQPGGAFSVGGEMGSLQYLASLVVEPRYEPEERRESSIGHLELIDDDSGTAEIPAGPMVQNQTKDERFIRDQRDVELTTNLNFLLDEHNLLQLNGQYKETSPPREVDRYWVDYSSGTPEVLEQHEDKQAVRNSWELGGTYEHKTDVGRYNTIFIVNDKNNDYTTERFELEESDNWVKNLYTDMDRRNRERILRTSYSRPLFSTQDIELGVEAAQTIVDKRFKSGYSRTDPSPDFGGLDPQYFSQSTAEEIRYEPFVTYNWQVNDAVSLETSLVAEFSEITLEGVDDSFDPDLPGGSPLDTSRSFEFYKPKVDLRYNLSQSLMIRTTVERTVSQLDFGDFTASNDGDVDSNVASGNPSLVPEKAWEYEVNLEYRLANDAGVLNSKFFYDDITDVIDRVDVSTPDATELSLSSAPGNIGNGKRYGLDLDASIRLGFIDLPDALVTAGIYLQDSEVMDPFLNQERRFSGEGRGNWSLGYRQDLPAWNLNYGFDYKHFLRGENVTVDIDDIGYRERDPASSVFIEKVAFNDVTFRLESFNLFNGNRCMERERYHGRTSDGVLEEVESSCIGWGRKIALKVRTTF